MPIEFTLPSQATALETALGTRVTFPLTVFESLEGTIIRVYYHHDEWQISSSSRLDAFTSFWASSQSFGKQFEEFVFAISGVSLDVFLHSLNPERSYFFLLPTIGVNRLGKKLDVRERARIFLVATEDRHTHEFLYGTRLPREEHNLWLYPLAWTVHNFQEWIELGSDQNLIYYHEQEIYRTVTEEYARLFRLRNNEQNLRLRYIELCKSDRGLCRELEAMYSEFDFDGAIHQVLHRIARLLHQHYMERFVLRKEDNRPPLPKPFFILIRKCHQRFLETRQKTTPATILEMIWEQEPKHILNLLKHY